MAVALGPADLLPRPCRRILVAGTSGSGKSTLARAVAGRLGVPYHELDALYHGPGWVPRPSFVDDVTAFADGPAWVTEWQYTPVRSLLLARAELLVWLDLSRVQVARQLVPRTVLRRLRRDELWNGNVEPPLWTVFTDPDHLLRWAWRTHRPHGERVAALLAPGAGPPVVRLRNRADVAAWLAGPVSRA